MMLLLIDLFHTDEPTKNIIKTEPVEVDDESEDVSPAEILPCSGVAQYIHQVAAQVRSLRRLLTRHRNDNLVPV